MGKLFATCTSETTNGLAFRLIISQPDAALYIQVPMFETTVAVQITVKAGCRKAPPGLGFVAVATGKG
jgi:hypothetical protein